MTTARSSCAHERSIVTNFLLPQGVVFLKRISLLVLWFFISLMLLPCTRAEAKESEIRLYIEYVMPKLGENDARAKAIAGLTFKNLNSNKLRVPFIAASGKGENHRDLEHSELPYSILVHGQSQFSGNCARITYEWVDNENTTAVKDECSFSYDSLILAAGDAETLQFVIALPSRPGIYTLVFHFDNRDLWKIVQTRNSRLLQSKVNGGPVYFRDSTSTDVELKAIKAPIHQY